MFGTSNAQVPKSAAKVIILSKKINCKNRLFASFYKLFFKANFVFLHIFLCMMQKLNEIKLDWKDCFGQSRQYTLFLMKSQHEPLRFASVLSKLFRKDFSFIMDYAPDRLQPHIHFPAFFAVLDASKDINMLVMANRTTIPSRQNVQPANPLLGLSLFEDNFFFFNFRKDKLFQCPYRNYDFLVILYSDKDDSIMEIEDILSSDSRFETVNVSDFLLKDVVKNEASRRIATLQEMIEYFGVLMSKIQKKRIHRYLGNKEIPMLNHVDRRFQIDQVITSPLLYREDI